MLEDVVEERRLDAAALDGVSQALRAGLLVAETAALVALAAGLSELPQPPQCAIVQMSVGFMRVSPGST